MSEERGMLCQQHDTWFGINAAFCAWSATSNIKSLIEAPSVRAARIAAKELNTAAHLLRIELRLMMEERETE